MKNEQATHTPGEWIEWAGGECPVPAGFQGFIRYRDGVERPLIHRSKMFWEHYGNGEDIIAYRVVSQ